MRGPLLHGLNAFVDLCHLNTTLDLPAARDAGLAGVILKLTQHTSLVDPRYVERLAQARELGLLVGAYHFCTGADVGRQLDHFLEHLHRFDAKGVLPCVDFAANPDGHQGDMTRQQLIELVARFQAATGRYPVVYGGYWMLARLDGLETPGPLAHCPLWQAFHSSTPGFLSGIWDRWTLHQYTDGRTGPEPRAFEGIGPVGRSTFNGSLAEARAFWQAHALGDGRPASD